MRQLILILTILLIGCGTKTADTTTDSKIEKETFDNFIKKFKSDSLFQIERVKFPLTLVTWDNDDNLSSKKIKQENWRHLNFGYLDQVGTSEIDGFTHETKVYSDSAKIELRGIDNGIYLDYIFTKVNGLWTLTTKRDYSD
jgi:hypothetical protein